MDHLSWLFGTVAPGALTVSQAAARAAVVYIAGIVLVRIGKRRFMGHYSAFDVLLGVVLGSVLSRAINGTAGLLPTLASGLVLVSLHRLSAALAFRSHRLGVWLKGMEDHLVRNGQFQRDAMRRHYISEHDILEAVRIRAQTENLRTVAAAIFERNGEISVVTRNGEPAEG